MSPAQHAGGLTPITGGRDVLVQFAIATNQPAVAQQIKDEAQAAINALPGVGRIDLRFDIQNPLQTSTGVGPSRLEGTKYVIAAVDLKRDIRHGMIPTNFPSSPLCKRQ